MSSPGPIAHHQLAPWIKRLGPLTREQDARHERLTKKRFDRKVERYTLKHRLAGRLIHASQERDPSGDKDEGGWVGVTWHGYDKWLEENGARK